MRRADACERILELWLRWNEQLNDASIDIAEGAVLHHFWLYLRVRHPQVIDFASHDPYREMCTWLAEDALP